MKTLKKIEIVPVFVEFIPDTMKQDILYISKEYHCAIHLCLCGCGNKVVTPLNHISEATGNKITTGWDYTEKDGKVSLSPSIGNYNFPCQYHYIITNNVANVV